MPLLEIEQVSKRFGGVQALSGVTLEVEAGRLTGLIGPNGAGKTTLFNVISGIFPPDAGRIRFKGQDITGQTSHETCHRGIARTFQIVQPFARLSVVENVAVALLFGRKGHGLSRRAAERQAERLLGYGKLAEKARRAAGTLTLSERKRLEMVRALATGPELLLLDEVLAGLTPQETEEMGEIIRKIQRELGLAILLIEHNMRAVMSLSERLVVLNYGVVIAHGPPEAVAHDPAVIKAYLGESRQRSYSMEASPQ